MYSLKNKDALNAVLTKTIEEPGLQDEPKVFPFFFFSPRTKYSSRIFRWVVLFHSATMKYYLYKIYTYKHLWWIIGGILDSVEQKIRTSNERNFFKEPKNGVTLKSPLWQNYFWVFEGPGLVGEKKTQQNLRKTPLRHKIRQAKNENHGRTSYSMGL